ncbi:transport permease protein [Betaproteobacteria bacterium]|nr:transport permease protein [Betaproteobacteria bacterium]GHU21566.1 transport permease protein [Betaproteobacteria bacterium]
MSIALLARARASTTLLRSFVRRELTTRYAGTLLGGVWALGQPVLLLAIYAFVFRTVFKVQIPDTNVSFVTLVACALWPWMAFQEAVQRGTVAITANAELVRKIRFPHHLLVYAAVLGSFIIHGAGFIAVALVLALAGEPLHLAGLPVVLAAWAVALLLALAVALATAALQVVIKDVEPALGPLFMLLFYATPVLYPLSMVPDMLRPWVALNPFVHVVEPIRAALLDGEALAAFADLWPPTLLALVLLACSRWLFRRLAVYFQDFL